MKQRRKWGLHEFFLLLVELWSLEGSRIPGCSKQGPNRESELPCRYLHLPDLQLSNTNTKVKQRQAWRLHAVRPHPTRAVSSLPCMHPTADSEYRDASFTPFLSSLSRNTRKIAACLFVTYGGVRTPQP